MRLDATGSVICQTSISEQGQGSESLTAQIVGSVLGVSMQRVRVILGDTDNTPYGGGTWASRGAGIGGEAALQAAKIFAAISWMSRQRSCNPRRRSSTSSTMRS